MISAAILNFFAIVGLASNIGQIVQISQMNYALPLKKVQQQVMEIKSHGLAVARLIMLSIPLYMAYVFLGFDVMYSVDLYQLMSEQTIGLFAIISAALYVPVFYVIRQMGVKSEQPEWAKKFCSFIVGSAWLHMTAVLNSFEQQNSAK